MRATLGLGLAVLMGAFSGCVGEASGRLDTPVLPDGSLPTSGAAPASDPGARPNWTHGDWFEYEVKFDNGFVTLETRERLVVARADQNGYTLGAGNRDLGVIDAHFDDFFVGDLDLDLNAVLLEGAKWHMFDWPLEDGKGWDSEVRTDPFTMGPETIRFVATKQDLVVDPRGEGPGFFVEGRTELGYAIQYTYSSRVGWITEYVKKDPTGKAVLSLKLMDKGSNYEGVFHLVSKEDLLLRIVVIPFGALDPAFAPAPPDRVTVRSGYTFLQEILGAFTFGVPANGSVPAIPGGGAFHVEVLYPDNSPRGVTHVGTGDSFRLEVTDLEPYAAGTYTVTMAGAGIGGAFAGYFGFTDEVVEFTPQSHANHG